MTPIDILTPPRVAQLLQVVSPILGGNANQAGVFFGMQVGLFENLPIAPGGTAYELPLPKPWTIKHSFFICTIHPLGTNAGVVIHNNGPYDGTGTANNSVGFVLVDTAANQNVNIYFLSIGA